MNNKSKYYNLVMSGLLLALALVLPFLTLQIPKLGNMLLPMHFPILICAFICGPYYALAIGFMAPILRFFLFGMPPIMPTGLAMAFELLAYGLVCGLLYKKLKKNKINIYISLIIAMILGRLVWGLTMVILTGLNKATFSLAIFFTSAVTNAIPGIILQIILIPVIVMLYEKTIRVK